MNDSKQPSRVQDLDFSWAHNRWEDPLTGTQVVRLSPEGDTHFRNTYFRVNMISADVEMAATSSRMTESTQSPPARPFGNMSYLNSRLSRKQTTSRANKI